MDEGISEAAPAARPDQRRCDRDSDDPADARGSVVDCCRLTEIDVADARKHTRGQRRNR
jgi:hypothetical protein